MDEAAARELLEAIYQFVMVRQAAEQAGRGADYTDVALDAAVATVAGLLSGVPVS